MSAYERFIFQRIVSILRSILNPLIMLLLLLWGYKAIALVVVTTICNVLTLFVNYVYCKKRLKLGLTFGWIEKPLIIEITTFSFWVFLAALTDKIYWSWTVYSWYCSRSCCCCYIFSCNSIKRYVLFVFYCYK